MEYISDAGKKHLKFYEEFKYLWKIDDTDWVKKRKQDYITQFGKPKSLSDKYRSNFYVYGKDVPDRVINDTEINKIEFEFKDRLWMTPFETQDQIQRFWEVIVKNRLVNDQKYKSFSYFSFYTNKIESYNSRIEMICDTFLNMDNFYNKDLVGLNSIPLINEQSIISLFSSNMGVFVNYKEGDYESWRFRYLELFLLSVKRIEEEIPKHIGWVKDILYPFFRNMLKNPKVINGNFPEIYMKFREKIVNIKDHPEACQLLKDCYDEANK